MADARVTEEDADTDPQVIGPERKMTFSMKMENLTKKKNHQMPKYPGNLRSKNLRIHESQNIPWKVFKT